MKNKFLLWLANKIITAGINIDWTLGRGDVVYYKGMRVEIVDINWALKAAAIDLGEDKKAIIVVPVWALQEHLKFSGLRTRYGL